MVLVSWWWRSDWSFAQLIAPVVTTTTIILSFNKTGNPGSVEQETQLMLTKSAMHLCKRNGVADFLKTRPSPYSVLVIMLIRSFCINGYRHKYRRTPKLGRAEPLPLVVGRGWHPKQVPFPYVLPRQIS